MISYKKYEEKMRKIAKVRHTIYRLRLLIGSMILLVIALIVSFLSTKGIIIKGLECPLEITYGDDYLYTAKALFSDVSYEFRPKGRSEWSDEKPYLPGEYEMRAISNRFFGAKGYSDIQVFSILPKDIEIKVKDSKITYGDEPSLTADLVGNDRIAEVEFNYENIELTSTVVNPIDSSIVIVDETGRDVTKAYDIKTVKSDITFLKRNLTLQINSETKIYDGKELNAKDYTIVDGSFGFSDTINIDFSTGISSVGNTIVKSKNAIIKNYDKDVTNHYNLTILEGNLEITKRPLTITTASEKKVYDGLPLTNSEINLSQNGLVAGHHIEKIKTTSIVNAICAKNQVEEIQILDEAGNDVTENYDINYEYGLLEIEKRKITLESFSKTKVYDGLKLSNNLYQINSGSLADGDKLSVSLESSIINVEKTTNQFSDVLITNFAGDNVTANYNINYIEGTLEILPRRISLSGLDHIFVYNGLEQKASGYQINSGSLVPMQTLNVTISGSLIKVGQIPTSFESIVIKDEYGNDVTANYEIDEVVGSITILKRKISIKPIDLEIYYTGYEIMTSHYEFTDASLYQLAYGDFLTDVTTSKSLVDAGNYFNQIISCKIYNINKEDVTDCYEIDMSSEARLNIKRRPIIIIPESKNKVYDGVNLVTDQIIITDESRFNLASTDFFSDVRLNNSRILNAGSIDVTIANYVIVNSEGKDVTNNYEITEKIGKLTITPRPITIKPIDVSKVYDGQTLGTNNIVLSNKSSYSLIPGDAIYGLTTKVITYVGKSLNSISKKSVIITNSTGDITSNYEITYEDGYLEILPRNISIKPIDKSKVYDGTNLEILADNGFEYLSSTRYFLAIGDELNATYNGFQRYVGSTNISFETIQIQNSENIDVTDCYIIDKEDGILTIYERSISIKPEDVVKVYDGIALTSNKAVLAENSRYDLAIKDRVEITTNGSVVNATETEYLDNAVINEIVDYKILNSEGLDVTYCYNVDVNIGYLSVLRREISISPQIASKVYDGTFLTSNKVVLLKDSKYQLVSNHEIEIITNGKVKYVSDGRVKNQIESFIIYNNNQEDVSYNYKVNTVDSSLEILARKLSIKPMDINKVYDGFSSSVTSVDYLNNTMLAYEDVIKFELLNYNNFKNVSDSTDNNTISNVQIFNTDGIDVTSSYEIDLNPGCVIISKRKIAIQPQNVTRVYDGDEFIQTKGVLVNSTLGKGDNLSITSETLKDNTHGVIQYNVIHHEIYDNYLVNTTNNYEVTYLKGEINILPRPITIKPIDIEHEYDGTIFKYNLNTVEVLDNSYGLVKTHSLLVNSVLGSIVNVGITKSTINSVSIYQDEINVTDNYDITFIDGTLTVLKRQITINLNDLEKVYDGTNRIDLNDAYTLSKELAPNDKISLNILSDNSTIGTHVTRVLTAFVFKDNNDVTNNYDLSFTNGSIKINKRDLVVSPVNATKVYDGQPLGITEVIVNGLVENHEFIFTSNTITNVGSVDFLVQSYDILAKNGKSLLENYNVRFEKALISVKKREINVEFRSEFEYDGTNHHIEHYYFTNETYLAKGDIFTFSTNNSQMKPGTYYFDIANYQIFNSYGYDVTNNYIINKETGCLVINKRKVTVQILDKQKVYDGMPLTSNEYEVILGSLVTGDILEVMTNGSIVYYQEGGIINDYLSHKIYDLNNQEVSTYYEIEFISGKLNIIKRDITIKTSSANFVYNTNFHSSDDYEIVSGNLVLKDIIKVQSKFFKDVQIINGKVVGYDNTLSVLIYNDSIDVTSSYNITYEYGIVTIEQYTVYYKTPSNSIMYDINNPIFTSFTIAGDEANSYLNTDKLIIKSKSLANSKDKLGIVQNIQELSVDSNNYQFECLSIGQIRVSLSITYKSKDLMGEYNGQAYQCLELGTISYTDTFGGQIRFELNQSESKKYINAGVYNNEQSLIFKYENKDVTDFIVVKNDYGKITITTREITIQTASAKMEYNGQALTTKHENVVVKTILGHIVKYNTLSEITYPGSIDNVVDKINIYDGLLDVTNNYSIRYNYGTLTVYARLKITTASQTFVYDQEKHYLHSYTIDEDSNILFKEAKYKFNLEFLYNKSNPMIHAGTYYNIASLANVYNDLEVDVTNYIQFEYTPGNICIERADLTIESISLQKNFDGTNIINHSYKINGLNTIYNDSTILVANKPDKLTLEFNDDEQAIYSGESRENKFTFNITNNNFNVSRNYNVTVIYGLLVISGSKQVLILTPSSITKLYDGVTINKANISYRFGLGYLPTGFDIKISEIKIMKNNNEVDSITDVGEYIISFTNKDDIRIYNEQDIDITNNYDIYIQTSKIRVIKASISVSTEDMYRVYTGKSVSTKEVNISISNGKLPAGTEIKEAKFEYIYNKNPEINHAVIAGEYTIRIASFVLVDASGNVIFEFKYNDSSNLDVDSVDGNFRISFSFGILTIADTNS